MKSKWFKLKPKAVRLRRRGNSIVFIEKTLGIPRSTLSGWFKNIVLTKIQVARLKHNSEIALNEARKNAVIWHNTQKENRVKLASDEADKTLNKLRTKSKYNIELALAMLYLGEGAKTKKTSMGNSDPLILKFFVCLLNKHYKIPIEKMRCHLHLRADQDSEETKKYWSKTLKIPLSNFHKSLVDKRTLGKPTYPYYKGVCIVDCGNIAIQRKLVYLSRMFCEKIIDSLRG